MECLKQFEMNKIGLFNEHVNGTFKKPYFTWNFFRPFSCWYIINKFPIFNVNKMMLNKDISYFCRNPNLGLATKARACKGVGQEGSPRVWENVRMNTHTPKWAPILGVGISVDSQIFREWLQGLKLNGLRLPLYHWKAIET